MSGERRETSLGGDRSSLPQPRLRRLPVDQRNFKGSDPRGRPGAISAAAADSLDEYWRQARAYDRRAVVTGAEWLTSTGTLGLTLQVLDGNGVVFRPGQFIGVQDAVAGVRRRTPYCIMSPPDGGDTFRLLVRVVPEGPLSRYLATLRVDDPVAFRGPTGRSMIPREDGTDVVLLATGVGISPFYSLARYLLDAGTDRRIQLLWGLRLEDDICLVDELDDLVARHPNFSYHISLSQPSARWQGARGRLTDTAPGLIGPLTGKHFYMCGNGSMTNLFATALSELGVDETLIYQEPFFNSRHKAEEETLARLRSRLAGEKPLSPVLTGDAPLFVLERPLNRRQD